MKELLGATSYQAKLQFIDLFSEGPTESDLQHLILVYGKRLSMSRLVQLPHRLNVVQAPYERRTRALGYRISSVNQAWRFIAALAFLVSSTLLIIVIKFVFCQQPGEIYEEL